MTRFSSTPLLLLVTSFGLSSPLFAEPVTFTVQTPYCTPRDAVVYLRSNRLEAGTYEHDAMERLDRTHHRLTVEVATPRSSFRYKYSNTICNVQSCPGIEKALTFSGSGDDIEDRQLVGAVTQVEDIVYVWRNAVVHFDGQGQSLGERLDPDERVSFCAPYLSVSSTDGDVTLGYDSFFAEPVTLEYGGESVFGWSQSSASSYRNHFVLTDLVPQQRIHYRLLEGGQELYRGSFVTPPEPASGFRFGLFGDIQFISEEDRQEFRPLAQHMLDFDPQLLLSVGDMVQSEKIDDVWTTPEPGRWNVFFDEIAPLLAKVPFNAVMGNHEEDGAYFWDVFDFPTPDAPALDHYWFRFGNTLFIGLYTGRTEGYSTEGILDSQSLWLQQVLSGTAGDPTLRWRVVYLHRGVFAEGHHGDGVQFYQGGNGSRPSWADLYQQYGVDLVLGGHNHSFSLAQANGTHFLTMCAGAPAHEINSVWQPETIYAEATCAAGLFEVGQQLLRFRAQRPDGTLIEPASFALCRQASDCLELDNPCAGAVDWTCPQQRCVHNCVEPEDAGLPQADAGSPEDGAAADVRRVDANVPDVMQPDAIQPDVARPDVMRPDAIQPDAIQPDAIQPDAVQPDALRPDRELSDTVPTDTEVPDVAVAKDRATSAGDSGPSTPQGECGNCAHSGGVGMIPVFWLLVVLGIVGRRRQHLGP